MKVEEYWSLIGHANGDNGLLSNIFENDVELVNAIGYTTMGAKCNPSLVAYLQNTILPQYATIGGGHGYDHINMVVTGSIYLSATNNCDIPLDMVCAAAYYHDLGLKLGTRKGHEEASKDMFLNNEAFAQFFTPCQIVDIAYAIAAHRASRVEPIDGCLGNILSDADREPAGSIMSKILRVCKSNIQDGIVDPTELCEVVYALLHDKYGRDGYARKPYFAYTQRRLQAFAQFIELDNAKNVISEICTYALTEAAASIVKKEFM
jgi:hypothetical protein